MKKLCLLLSIFAFVFALFSCSDEIEDPKTCLVFSQNSRAAEKSAENLTKITLEGKSSAGTLSRSWEKWSELSGERIEIGAGLWDFTLTAFLGDEKYSAAISAKIESGKDNFVEFKLKRIGADTDSEKENGNEETEEIGTVAAKFTSTPIYLPEGTDGTAGTSGVYVLFGDFPQTIKASDVAIDESDSITVGSNIYYAGSDGKYYAKVEENGYSTDYQYSDGTQVAKKNTDAPNYLYFKVEPIKWRVLTDDYSGKKLLLAENSLIAHKFGGSANNNYAESEIRSYLNDEFFNTAFTETARNSIAQTNVDNSIDTATEPGSSQTAPTSYICVDTIDKVFLLSESEVTNSTYGFPTATTTGSDSLRIRLTTDYAKANYAQGDSANTSSPGGVWWLRSPHYKANRPLAVGSNGKAYECPLGYQQQESICPALCLE